MLNESLKVETLLRQAGSIAMLRQNQKIKTYIYNNEIVTNVQLELNEYLNNGLININGNCNIISPYNYASNLNMDNTWIINPLDGIENYIHKFQSFAITVVKFENGKPEYCLIYNPATEDLYSATKGLGAYKNNYEIKVSNNVELNKAIVIFDFANDFDIRNCSITEYNYNISICNAIKKLYMKNCELKKIGPLSLDLARVAEGYADGYFKHKLCPYNHLAGQLLLEEAGGKITVEKDNKRDVIIADNKLINLSKIIDFRIGLSINF